MKEFSYVIKDEMGIHARPAAMLATLARQSDSVITISAGGKSVDAAEYMAIMSMCVKAGDVVKVSVEGGTEEKLFRKLKKIFSENL